MRSSEFVSLPQVTREYNSMNAQSSRSTTEKFIQDLRNDIIDVRDTNTSDASLALRRHQFLLMGA